MFSAVLHVSTRGRCSHSATGNGGVCGRCYGDRLVLGIIVYVSCDFFRVCTGKDLREKYLGSYDCTAGTSIPTRMRFESSAHFTIDPSPAVEQHVEHGT